MRPQKFLISAIFIVILLLVINVSGFAQINEDLIDLLNEVRTREIESKKQYDYHSVKFDMLMPYHQIIIEKEETIQDLTRLIDALKGQVENLRIGTQAADLLTKALNSDAALEIDLVRLYDKILSQFGHPEMARLVAQARRLAIEHFMLLTNTAQRAIEENRLDDRLKRR
ncbi:MAG: hypothetical protein KKF93_00160 [Candidatus Omnitrophica bacterium]|nr:hypothetical protein [Candidatus Omnitrophota bacterium]